jgi:hypothetical protein
MVVKQLVGKTNSTEVKSGGRSASTVASEETRRRTYEKASVQSFHNEETSHDLGDDGRAGCWFRDAASLGYHSGNGYRCHPVVWDFQQP